MESVHVMAVPPKSDESFLIDQDPASFKKARTEIQNLIHLDETDRDMIDKLRTMLAKKSSELEFYKTQVTDLNGKVGRIKSERETEKTLFWAEWEIRKMRYPRGTAPLSETETEGLQEMHRLVKTAIGKYKDMNGLDSVPSFDSPCLPEPLPCVLSDVSDFTDGCSSSSFVLPRGIEKGEILDMVRKYEECDETVKSLRQERDDLIDRLNKHSFARMMYKTLMANEIFLERHKNALRCDASFQTEVSDKVEPKVLEASRVFKSVVCGLKLGLEKYKDEMERQKRVYLGLESGEANKPKRWEPFSVNGADLEKLSVRPQYRSVASMRVDDTQGLEATKYGELFGDMKKRHKEVEERIKDPERKQKWAQGCQVKYVSARPYATQKDRQAVIWDLVRALKSIEETALNEAMLFSYVALDDVITDTLRFPEVMFCTTVRQVSGARAVAVI